MALYNYNAWLTFFPAQAEEVFARRRSYLYLGAALGTASLYLCLVGMFNMFFDSGVAHEVQVRWDINMR